MQKPYANDTEMLRRGEAMTEYNDNASTIYRLDTLKRQANMARMIYTFEGLMLHLAAIKGMEQELAGKLDDREIEALDKKRVSEIMPSQSKNVSYIFGWRRRLEGYEQHIRELLQKKGLGVTAKKESDPRKAILE